MSFRHLLIDHIRKVLISLLWKIKIAVKKSVIFLLFSLKFTNSRTEEVFSYFSICLAAFIRFFFFLFHFKLHRSLYTAPWLWWSLVYVYIVSFFLFSFLFNKLRFYHVYIYIYIYKRWNCMEITSKLLTFTPIIIALKAHQS